NPAREAAGSASVQLTVTSDPATRAAGCGPANAGSKNTQVDCGLPSTFPDASVAIARSSMTGEAKRAGSSMAVYGNEVCGDPAGGTPVVPARTCNCTLATSRADTAATTSVAPRRRANEAGLAIVAIGAPVSTVADTEFERALALPATSTAS